MLVATLPNFSALSRRLLGNLWPQYKVEHLHYFSSRSIVRLEEAASFTSVLLKPHVKKLPLDYLINIGEGFGHPYLRLLFGQLRKVTPRPLLNTRITAPFGEWLWIAKKVGVN